MKRTYLLVSFMLIIFSVRSQSKDPFGSFINSFERKFHVPIAHIRDSCAMEAFLLKVAIDIDKKTSELSFSDSAPEDFKKELFRVSRNLEVTSLQKFVETQKSKKLVFLFPVFFTNIGLPCNVIRNVDYSNKSMSKFNTMNFMDCIYLADPINLVIDVVNTRKYNN